MTVVVVGEAEREFVESVAYYEAKEAGLGWRFRTEVAEAVGWIEKNAELPRLRTKGYRRRNLKAFPHYIAYILRGEVIWIVAIAHGHRRPEFWLGRV
ncbi:MAG TPA: type II toxin-antitoxin system RelE/ParE family toxin [Chthoniobacterales bacterium]|jgi:toxin ParE1/3/4